MEEDRPKIYTEKQPAEKLPKHAFPLQNLELEKLKLFYRQENEGGESTPHIAMAMRDPGEAAALMPVLEELKGRGVNISLWTDSKAEEKFNPVEFGFIPQKIGTPIESGFTGEKKRGIVSLSFVDTIPDLVVCGMSMHPGSELSLTENARFDGVPVVWLSDYVMGSLFARNRDMAQSVQSVLPDYLLVANDWIREQELMNLPEGFDPNRVIVTGQPTFDAIAHERKDEVRKQIREVLKISDKEKLITYVGAVGDVSSEALRVLVEGLKGTGFENYKLVICRHPRDQAPQEQYLTIAEDIHEKVIDQEGQSVGELVLASDLVANTLSTVGLESILRGTPVVHIWIDEILRKSELQGKLSLPSFVQDGSSPAIFEEKQSSEVLRKLLTDPDYIESLKLKMKRYQSDGHAAERVANFILGLLKL